MGPDERLGTVLAERWRLDRVLGRGGMATVYAATHRTGSRIAIKVPHGGEPELLVRFLKEGYLGNRVEHHGVVRTLDDGVTADGLPFLVMELLEGETVSERLDREGPLPPVEAARIAGGVLDVLAVAHAARVIHRDVKPANVFVTRAGAVKLLDFGIARELHGPRPSATAAGVILGSPSFMAPEQACGHADRVGARSDLWAVAAMLFVALTDSDLHGGTTPMERLAAAMLPVPPVRSLAPTIPVSLANVLDRALAFEPEDRFASAHEMQAAVRAAMGAVAEPTERVRPGKIPQLRPKTRGRMPTPAEIAGVVLVCGAVLSVVLGIALGVDATPSSPRAILPPVPVAPASTSAPPTERSDLPDGPLVAITAAPPARLPAPPPPARALVRTPDASSARVPPPPPPPSARRAVDPLAGRF